MENENDNEREIASLKSAQTWAKFKTAAAHADNAAERFDSAAENIELSSICTDGKRLRKLYYLAMKAIEALRSAHIAGNEAVAAAVDVDNIESYPSTRLVTRFRREAVEKYSTNRAANDYMLIMIILHRLIDELPKEEAPK